MDVANPTARALLCLEVLQDSRVLRLSLLTGLGHLRQLLLGRLNRLL